MALKIPQVYYDLGSVFSLWMFHDGFAFIVCRDRTPVNRGGTNQRSPRRERRTLGQIRFRCRVSGFCRFRTLSKDLFKCAAALWLVVSTAVLLQFQNDGKVSHSLCLMLMLLTHPMYHSETWSVLLYAKALFKWSFVQFLWKTHLNFTIERHFFPHSHCKKHVCVTVWIFLVYLQ